jgi:hypothetical protein
MRHDYTHLFFPLWLYRFVAVGEQLLPLELASGTDEDQLHPTKSSMDTIGMALDQVFHTRLKISVQNHAVSQTIVATCLLASEILCTKNVLRVQYWYLCCFFFFIA